VRVHATYDRLNRLQKALLCCWLLVFVLVSSAEASHFCGKFVFHSWRHGSGSVEQSIPGEGGTCLICVATQSATVVVAATVWMPVFALSDAFTLEDFSVPRGKDDFSLYSRPPPAES